MATHRSINWSGAMHGLRAERTVSPFINKDGSFDLRAIMTRAIADARRIGKGLRLSWQVRLALTLKQVWHVAKQAAVTARPLAR